MDNSSHDSGSRGLPPVEPLQLTESPTTVEQYWRNGLLAREVGHQDLEGVEAFFRTRDEAIDTKQWDVLRAQEAYPVFVVTDTSKGQCVADVWDEQRNQEVMGKALPYFPPTELLHEGREYHFLTNDMVISIETNCYVLEGKKVTWKAANLLVKRDGKWKNKAILEGGFGDFMAQQGIIPLDGKR